MIDFSAYKINPDDVNGKWSAIRDMRDKKINEVEWMVSRHNRERLSIDLGIREQPTTMTDDEIIVVLLHIEELANIPQTFSIPDDVVFPVL